MGESAKILIVEDRQGEREALGRVLRMEGYDVLAAASPQEALNFLEQPVALILSDLRMGNSTGLDLLRYWKEQHPSTPFLMLTAYADVESAVAAMKLGAYDYVMKPVDPEQLLDLIRTCLAQQPTLPRPNHTGLTTTAKHKGMERIVGRSQAMLEVFDQTRRAALTESTVLILGESGTGKELIAEAIHKNSRRQGTPFVPVNMAAIPETLVESELFGHVKGAFTDATIDRIGRFEAANGGTIFIDEIGDFPVPSQAKLLRVLENRTVTPVGSNEDRGVDVRVVAATSRNLQHKVATGQFRADLYYRLNVLAIHLPPLRDRREDIPLLVAVFIHYLCQANRVPALDIDPQLMSYLEQHPWPGNVRQLRNCLESMVVMARRPVLTLADLPQCFTRPFWPPGNDDGVEQVPMGDRSLEDLQRDVIVQTLKQHEGNRTQTAKALGISLRTLQRRLTKWQLHE